MKICRPQFKLLVLPAVCLCLGLLLFATPAKAAETLGYDFSIPSPISGNSGNNNYIGLDFIASTTNITSFDFKFGDYYNGQSKTVTYQVCEDPNQGGVSDPCSGLTILGTGDYTFTAPNNGDIVNVPFSSSINLTIGHRYGVMIKTAVSGFSFYFSTGGSVNDGTQMIGALADGTNRDFWAKIYYEAAPINLGNFYWAGVGTQELKKYEITPVPFFFDYCANYDSVNSLTAYLMINDNELPENQTTLIQDKTTFIGPQKCKGLFYLNIDDSAGAIPATGTFKLQMVVNGTTVETGNDYNYSVSSTPTNWIENGISDAGLKINIDAGSATSTPLGFNFDFTGLATGTNVCLAYNRIGASDDCITVSVEKGYGEIDIPTATSVGDVQVSFIDETLNLVSDIKTVHFWSKYQTITNTIGTPHDLACSAEEWADTNWWTQIRCSSVEAGYRFSENIQKLFQQFINDSLDIFSDFFPFNIPIKISQSFTESASSTLPTDIAWLNATNENGDLTIKIPGNWNRGATGTELILWGDSIFKNGDPELAAVFIKIRALSTYLIWAGFIVAMWFIGKNVYNEIRYQDTIDTHRENDWQL